MIYLGHFEGLNNLKLVDPPAQLRGMGILKILRARGSPSLVIKKRAY